LEVRFGIEGRPLPVEQGENLLRAAHRAGVFVEAPCGGAGVCGRCRVKVVRGETEPPPRPDGFVRACRTSIASDLIVECSATAAGDRSGLEDRPRQQALAAEDLESVRERWGLQPSVKSCLLSLEPPTIRTNEADLSRLRRAIACECCRAAVEIDLDTLKELPQALRSGGWEVEVVVHRPIAPGSDAPEPSPRILRVSPGPRSAPLFAVAVDIGTTTVHAVLLDIETGRPLAQRGEYNDQRRFGEDVISRIDYACRGEGLAELQRAVVGTVNRIVDDLLAQTGIDRSRVLYLLAAGNTTMAHLALGLDPKYLRLDPYVPAARFFPPVAAEDLGIRLGRGAVCEFLPAVSSYVGGDIVSGVLAVGMEEDPRTTLYIDIGTNGEVVIGNREFLVTASCSAGPAFEGAGLRCGMRAAAGAVEAVRIRPQDGEPMALTVGLERARGICGSGAISLLSELVLSGILEQNGTFSHKDWNGRVREGAGGWEFAVVRSGQSATGEAIVLTEADIDNLMRAKGAIYAGCGALLGELGLAWRDIERVLVAGAFGSSLDLESAIAIGLLPDIDRDRFRFVGNGSLLGARLAAASMSAFAGAIRIAERMTNVELIANHTFQEEYTAAQFFPHTREDLFPVVWSRIRGRAGGEVRT